MMNKEVLKRQPRLHQSYKQGTFKIGRVFLRNILVSSSCLSSLVNLHLLVHLLEL